MNSEKFLYNPIEKYDDATPLWFCFPCEYSIGMSSLGFLSLFRIMDENPKCLPERIFTDTNNTVLKLQDIKLMGFSYSFELDFLNIFKVLEKYQIPLDASLRNDNHPLIFGGGPVLSANPEPFKDMFDFIMIGDGEDITNELIDKIYELKNKNKKEILKELSEIEGIYVSTIPKQIKKRTTKNLDNCVYSPILTENTMFSNTFIIEIARGCSRGCNFCLTSYLNKPFRYPSFEKIKAAIDFGLKNTNKLGLLGALVCSHPDFSKICDYILKKREEKDFEVSISSLRADKLEPKTVKMLTKCSGKTATIAIEAGSERLRKFINKQLSEEQISDCVETARLGGLKGLKIYGMIGLPSETQEDIQELINLMAKLKKANKQFKLTLSTSSFVPKAHTPFERHGREQEKTLKNKLNLLKKEMHKMGIDFRPTSLSWDDIQGILSRGDSRLFPILKEVYALGGTIGSWGRAYKNLCKTKKAEIPEYSYYSNREIHQNEPLPWDSINLNPS